MRNIVLIGNTPVGVASYLAHRFLRVPYNGRVEDYVNITRLISSPTIGGDLVGLLWPLAFCDGGIENRAVIEYRGKQVSTPHHDFGRTDPILLSYVDGGIRNKSVLRVELTENPSREPTYQIRKGDIIVSGVDGGVYKTVEETVRIIIPNASEIETFYQRYCELEAELKNTRNRLSASRLNSLFEQLISEPTPD